jgi:hypothetical protein
VGDGEDPCVGPLLVFADYLDKRGRGGGVEHGGHLVADEVVEGECAGEAGSLELPVAEFVRAAVE